MLIAQMTDIHIGFEGKSEEGGVNRARFKATLDYLLASPNTPDMLVLSGDLTDSGDTKSMMYLAEMVSACPFPVLPMVGNHDTRDALLAAFPETATEGDFIHYAAERRGLRVLLLDSTEPGHHGGAFCDARAAWLSNQLAEHRATPTLIFMHHPPIVSGIDWMDPSPQEEWIGSFGDVVQGHTQIRGIHCGHLHRSVLSQFRGHPLGITASVAPLLAMDLSPISAENPDERAMIVAEPPAYALHRWDGIDLVTHYERVGDWDVVARYGPGWQAMLREQFAERG